MKERPRDSCSWVTVRHAPELAVQYRMETRRNSPKLVAPNPQYDHIYEQSSKRI